MARRRIGRKSVHELIEWRELIRVLHVCALVKGDRLENGSHDGQRINLLVLQLAQADCLLRNMRET